MKQSILVCLCSGLLLSSNVFAGNKDRAGQAAATELLINPWARSGGVFGLNGACVTGIESMKLNIGGLGRVKNYEMGATYNSYIQGAGIGIVNAAGASRLNAKTVLGVNIMSVNVGDIPVTTVDLPEGNGTTFKPSIFNASLGAAYSFTKHIDAGLNFTFINQSLSNVRASAAAIDAGIMYSTGENDELHFGISMRNVGSNLRYNGDGLTYNGVSPDNPDKQITVSSRSEKFALPTQLVISTAYDIYLGDRTVMDASTSDDVSADGATAGAQVKGKSNTRLTLMGSFISNSYQQDWIGAGAELALKEQFMLRAGYRYENKISDAANTATFYNGLSAGASYQFKFGGEEKQNKIAIDYAFKPTRLGAVHSVGLRLFR
jgi:hypothetical protein